MLDQKLYGRVRDATLSTQTSTVPGEVRRRTVDWRVGAQPACETKPITGHDKRVRVRLAIIRDVCNKYTLQTAFLFMRVFITYANAALA